MVPQFKGFIRLFVLICGGVFVGQMLIESGLLGGAETHHQFVRYLGLLPELFFKGAIYQPITWIFLHGNLMHFLFNMFAFWMFGSLLEDVFGRRRFARFVFISGVVFSILIAVSRLFPNQVVLLFFIFPLKMRYFAYVMVGIEFYMLYSSNQHGISNIAHLGGALVGYVYVSWLNSGRGSGGGSGSFKDWMFNLKQKWHHRRMRKKLRVIRTDTKKVTYH
jgi:membrane associated rhomboid family serine protease